MHALWEVTGLGLCFYDVDTAPEARFLLESNQARRLFFGHSHEPGWWEWPPGGAPHWTPVPAPSVLQLRPDRRYAVNLGSLGEPHHPGHPRYVRWLDGRVEWMALTQL